MAIIKTEIPTHTMNDGESIKTALQGDIKLIEDELNDIRTGGQGDLIGKILKAINGLELGGVFRAKWPDVGGMIGSLGQVLANGAMAAKINIGEILQITNNAGTQVHFSVDEKKGLQGLITRIANPMMHMGLKTKNEITNGGAGFVGTPTFTHPNTETYIDSLTGLLKTAAVNEPVIEARSDGRLGMRFHPAIHNFVPDSENGNYFIPNGGTVTANNTTGVDGAASMHTFVENGAAGLHEINKAIITLAGQQTYQFKLKAGVNVTDVALYIANATDLTFANVSINLINGTHTLVTGDKVVVKHLGDGIYLCAITATSTVTGSTYYVRNITGGPTHTGDGVSSFHFQHPQVNNGSVAAQYVPTTGSSLVIGATSVLSIQSVDNFPTVDITKDFCVEFDYESPVDYSDTVNLFNVKGVLNILARHSVGFFNGGNFYIGLNNIIQVPRAIMQANVPHNVKIVNSNGITEIWVDYERVATKASIPVNGAPLSIEIGGANYANISNINVRDFAPSEMELGA